MPDETVTLVAAVGDIHGRFRRVAEWLADLAAARGRPVDLALAVGDVEAFARDDLAPGEGPRRAAPDEFRELATGARALPCPLYFAGGNNEDFAALHPLAARGGALAPGVHYLGRAGVRALAGLRVAYLSGIHAPRHFAVALAPPACAASAKRAGYFRDADVAALDAARGAGVDLMLAHEWPRGLVPRAPTAGDGRRLRAARFPWVGNPVTRALVERVRPAWLLCGHTHVALAAAVAHGEGVPATRVACLDQAARPDGAVFWLEFAGGAAVRAGFGTTGEVAWRAGDAWDVGRTPACGWEATPGAARAAVTARASGGARGR